MFDKRTLFHVPVLLVAMYCFTVPYSALAQTTVFVNHAATGMNNGTSWTDAFVSLQDAIAVSASGDEIWVAAGTYHPDEGVGITSGDQTVSFQLDKAVEVYGGFSGNESSREERDWEQNITILSGDLLENDNDTISVTEPTRLDNSFQVVTTSEPTGSNVISGFTISGGNGAATCGGGIGDGLLDKLEHLIVKNNAAGFGGGLCLSVFFQQTQIRDVIFENNEATDWGGGILVDGIQKRNELLLDHVVFRDNRAVQGGGIHSRLSEFAQDRIMRLQNVDFIGNTAISEGGGLRHTGGRLFLTNTTFIGNAANTEGALEIGESFATITNSLFVGNTATGISGGMSIIESSAEIINSTIAFNTSGTTAGGIWHEGFRDGCSACTLMVKNSIIWGNRADVSSDQIFQWQGSSAVAPTLVSNSIVEGALGDGVIDNGNVFLLDPLFADPDGEDNIPFTIDDDYRLQAGSPAIDAGDNTALPPDSLDLDEDGNLSEPIPMDLDGNVRVFDGGTGTATVDLGPYEFGAPPLIVTVEEPAIPQYTGLTLDQPYPNPFGAVTTLTFSSQSGGRATLTVYDMLGRRVRVLFNGILQPDQRYDIVLPGEFLAPGAYLIRLQKGSRSASQIILRGR